MSDHVLHAEPYGSLLLAEEVPCLIVQWHGFANSAQFRGLMDEALARFGTEAQRLWPLGLVMDARQMSAIVPADQIWLETDWNPRAYDFGIRHLGIVTSENIFGRIATQVYSANTEAQEHYTIEPRAFAKPEDAKAWLRGQLRR